MTAVASSPSSSFCPCRFPSNPASVIRSEMPESNDRDIEKENEERQRRGKISSNVSSTVVWERLLQNHKLKIAN